MVVVLLLLLLLLFERLGFLLPLVDVDVDGLLLMVVVVVYKSLKVGSLSYTVRDYKNLFFFFFLDDFLDIFSGLGYETGIDNHPYFGAVAVLF